MENNCVETANIVLRCFATSLLVYLNTVRLKQQCRKLKAVQPFVEKIITIAKRGGLNCKTSASNNSSMIERFTAWVADPNVPDSKQSIIATSSTCLTKNATSNSTVMVKCGRRHALCSTSLTAVATKIMQTETVVIHASLKSVSIDLGDGTDLVCPPTRWRRRWSTTRWFTTHVVERKNNVRRDFAAKVLVSTVAC